MYFARKSIAAVALISLCGSVSGQAYPTKPIRIITPEVGGGANLTTRLMAEGLAFSLGQPVVIENRPSVTIAELLVRSNADGYTAGVAGSPAWIPPLLKQGSWDPIRDLAPISWMTQATNVLVVHPSVPAK